MSKISDFDRKEKKFEGKNVQNVTKNPKKKVLKNVIEKTKKKKSLTNEIYQTTTKKVSFFLQFL